MNSFPQIPRWIYALRFIARAHKPIFQRCVALGFPDGSDHQAFVIRGLVERQGDGFAVSAKGRRALRNWFPT